MKPHFSTIVRAFLIAFILACSSHAHADMVSGFLQLGPSPKIPKPVVEVETLLEKYEKLSSENIFQKLKLIGCENFPQGGATGLRIEFNEAVSKGLSCLAKTSPQYRDDIGRVLALFFDLSNGLKAVNLVCQADDIEEDALAAASSPDDPAYPYIDLSPSFYEKDDEQSNKPPFFQEPHGNDKQFRQAVFFHETLHLVGYEHGFGNDLSYLAEVCCFSISSSENNKKACDYLRQNNDWTSLEYLSFLHDLISGFSGLGSPAVQAAWRAVHFLYLDETSSDPRRNTEVLMRFTLHPAEESEDPDVHALQSLVLGAASLENLPQEREDALKAEFKAKILDRPLILGASAKANAMARHLGLSIAKLYRLTLNNDLRGILAAWPEADAARANSCRFLTGTQKIAINHMSDDLESELDQYHTKIPMNMRLGLRKLCE